MPGLRCVTLFFLILPLELDCPIWVNRKIIQLLTPNYGYLVGNPVTDGQFDNGAVVPYFHGMGLISDELHKVIQQRDDAEGNMQVL
ncbi:serine carboxypeptidase 1-like isoform X2 [Asparagus officinalis]|uniref:serine carboxypeptidase 1-like isoform X2 n=1 Tax=Asparagus officinalis TaxID=4686 RepID=UPI00098E0300|nr:serine carboxypeptidase 1-like isoform X2 [Asparagus officinalis]